MIHILECKTSYFDKNPDILLQYVNITRIFEKLISETKFIKNKLNYDRYIFYKEIPKTEKINLETFYRYIDSNDVSILICNIEIFENCYTSPNYYFNEISKKYPHIKFIVCSDETFFKYTEIEYTHSNVFYITNGIDKPYSFVKNINQIKNLTSYYIVNNYLQENYVYFIEKLFSMIDTMVKDKKYNFYNGVHKPHRLKCYEIIKKNDLLDDGYFSYADFALFSKSNDNIEYFMQFLDITDIKEFENYLSNFQIPLFYDTVESNPNVFVPFVIPPQTSFQSYITITTETNFQNEYDRDLVFSEKSFKPFYGFNIPLIIGQPTGLLYLKDLGFDLFEDFFDITPTYNKNDIFNQLDKNLQKLKKLNKLEIHNFYKSNLPRIYNNFYVLTHKLKKMDLENLNNFLKK
jgi:hypothetical protein